MRWPGTDRQKDTHLREKVASARQSPLPQHLPSWFLSLEAYTRLPTSLKKPRDRKAGAGFFVRWRNLFSKAHQRPTGFQSDHCSQGKDVHKAGTCWGWLVTGYSLPRDGSKTSHMLPIQSLWQKSEPGCKLVEQRAHHWPPLCTTHMAQAQAHFHQTQASETNRNKVLLFLSHPLSN